MIINVFPDATDPSRGVLAWRDGGGLEARVPCALGRGGVKAKKAKREGDGATPAGTFPLRRVHVREDRVGLPATRLVVRALHPNDGWCDDAASARYNRLVTLPFSGSHERMWRDDGLYDVVVEIGHNDDPPVANLGSAIFLHVMAEDRTPTEGCVAVTRKDLLALLKTCAPGDTIRIHTPA